MALQQCWRARVLAYVRNKLCKQSHKLIVLQWFTSSLFLFLLDSLSFQQFKAFPLLSSWRLDTTVWLNTGWNLSPFHRRCLNQFLFGAIPSNSLFYRWVLIWYGSEQLIFLTVLTRNVYQLCIAAVNDMGWISDCPVLHDIMYGIKPWKILHWYFIIALVPFAALPVLLITSL